MYPGFYELAEYITSLQMKTLFFTNATHISINVANKLMDLEAYPCVSLESTIPEIHDELVGVKGAFKKTIEGIDNLISVGYTDKLPLTTNTVVTGINYSNLPHLWEYVTKRNMDPFFLRLLVKGRGQHFPELRVSIEEIKKFVEHIATLKNYDPTVPFPGEEGCIKHFISCHVNAQGYVQPCPGVDVHCGMLDIKACHRYLMILQ